MKKTLLMLSFLSMFATQASASVDVILPPNDSNRVYNTATDDNANSDEIYVSSDAEISLAIQNLSAQAQQREDHLAALADRLSAQTSTTNNQSSFASASTVSVLNSSAPPAIAAARASSAAHSRTVGLCARYVRQALQSAGYSFTPNPSAYQYATRGTLAQAGFVKISNDTPPQVGDVVVYNRSAQHVHGHIQIFDGSSWVSDFRQARKSPYSGDYSYTTWRDSRYLNDASNQGIYLAMGDE